MYIYNTSLYGKFTKCRTAVLGKFQADAFQFLGVQL